MCMKNINTTINYEALDSTSDNFITKTNYENYIKIVPLKDDKAKLFCMFSASIINGEDAFFSKAKTIYFQIVLTNKSGVEGENIRLKEFNIPLSKAKNYYSCKYLDFTVCNDNFIVDLDLTGYNIDDYSVILILARTENENEVDGDWIPQSATPIKFEKA